MTKEETIQVLQSIEDRAIDFPCMTACDWVAIAAAKRHLQEEPVSEELEEAAKNIGQKYFPNEYNIWTRPNYEAMKAECAFKTGAKWQKKKDQETIETAIHHAYHNGRLEMKEQMMANAIDAEVLENYDGKVIKYDEAILDEKLSDCKVFDKIKLIMLKDD